MIKSHEVAWYLYKILDDATVGMDAIYEDYIIRKIGEVGLRLLLKNRLLEGCGEINGRKLYVLR